MAWMYLVVAGLVEIGFTTVMRYSAGFTKVGPSALVLVLAAISIVLVTKASESIPLGTAYAAWGAFGYIGTAVVGALYFNEPVTFWRIFFLSTLIFSIVGLKLVTD